MRRYLATLLAFAAFTAQADVLEGKVTAVADGDTITVLDGNKNQHRIRINGIDAPEKRQAYGERSKQQLSKMAFQKDARLECHKTDRYGRKAAKSGFSPWTVPAAARHST